MCLSVCLCVCLCVSLCVWLCHFCDGGVILRRLDWNLVHEAVGYTAEPLLSGLKTERWGWGSKEDIDFKCTSHQVSFQAELLPSSTAYRRLQSIRLFSGLQTEGWGLGCHDDIDFECTRKKAEFLPSLTA